MITALRTVRLLARKVRYELDGISALLRYPFQKRGLIKRLSSAIGNLNIETTNICNAKCVFCAYQYQTRPTGVMEMQLFKRIIREYVACGGGNLGFTPTVGDPLVDRHIVERVRFARAFPEIRSISMYSNLLALHKVGVESLVASGLTQLTVSTSGFDKEMYQRVYRSSMYEQMIQNLLDFAAANARLGKPVRVFVDMRVDRPVAEVLRYPDYERVAASLGHENIGVKFRYDSWGGKIKQEELPGTMKLRHNLRPRWSACTELFNGPMIYWDGKVGGCNCRDVDARELIVGNIREKHLADIWFGPELQRLRDEFTTSRMPHLCETCTHYNHLSLYLRRDKMPILAAMLPSKIRTGPPPPPHEAQLRVAERPT